MNSSISPPAVVIVNLSINELRALVREVVREALSQQVPAASAAPLVDRHELARLLGVSAATVARMTAEGMPHVFAGASPRYAPDQVHVWLSERGRKGTKAPMRTAEVSVAGVRLLSRTGR